MNNLVIKIWGRYPVLSQNTKWYMWNSTNVQDYRTYSRVNHYKWENCKANVISNHLSHQACILIHQSGHSGRTWTGSRWWRPCRGRRRARCWHRLRRRCPRRSWRRWGGGRAPSAGTRSPGSRVANDSRPGRSIDFKLMVELKILRVILCHDHAVEVDSAKTWLESIVADNRVQKSGRDHDR